MFERAFLFLFVTVLIFEATHQQLQRSVPVCDTNGSRYCWSCTTAATCINNNGVLIQYDTICSEATPNCGPDTSIPPIYGCSSAPVTSCTCTGTGLSYKNDPYNDHWYIICSGTSASYVDCGIDYYNDVTHSCVAEPPLDICSTVSPGIHADENSCDGYFVCTSDTSEPIYDKCTAPDNYFNPETNTCQEPIPLFQCQLGQFGSFADPFDCRRYYVCIETELIDAQCCAATEVFSEAEGMCIVQEAPTGCPMSDECAQVGTSNSTTTVILTSTKSTSSTISTSDGSTSTSTGSTNTATTTTATPSCIPISSFECPEPDGYFPQCNYCAKNFYRCVSGFATLESCIGIYVFNTVPTYPSCVLPEYCPYYPEETLSRLSSNFQFNEIR